MHTLLSRKSAGIALAAALIATGCGATATVTVSDSAVAAAAAPTADTSLATPTPVADEPAAEPATRGDGCRFLEIDFFDDIQIELEFTSTMRVQDDVSISYVLYDGNGDVIASSAALIEDLLPGERVRMAVDTVENVPTDPAAASGITCEIIDVSPFDFDTDLFRAQVSDTCRFLELDGVGDIQIEIDVVNPLSVPGDLVVDFAIRGPEGIRFGDGLVFTDSADPDERIVQAADTFTGLPDWVSESSVTCEILSIHDF